MQIELRKGYFSESERLFLEHDGLKATLFTYESGVHAVRMANATGEIVVLPFKGQQIWDAVFYGRRLTMKSMFPKPKNVSYFVNTYGCFLMHCGALRVGAPGPDDTHHPNHGELPYADYDKAWLTVDESEGGPFISIHGLYEYGETWGDRYDACPAIKLHKGSALLDVSMTIHNRSNNSMELMYLCHPNFLWVEGGKIIQNLTENQKPATLLQAIPESILKTPGLGDELGAETSLSRIAEVAKDYSGGIVLVFSVAQPHTDDEGRAHFMQLLPDGSADYVSYQPEELDHCVRWIAQSKNERVCGLALPATCGTEGYTEEKKKGTIKRLSSNEKRTFSTVVGCLNQKQAARMAQHIKSCMNHD